MGMITYAIDWGHGNKLTVFDGVDFLDVDTDLFGFIKDYAPCRIIIECTFESYHREMRNAVVKEAEERGVEILTVNPRQTANVRMSRKIEKSDEADARVIYSIWQEGRVHLAKPRLVPETEATRMKRIELLRRRGWPKAESTEFAQCLPKEVPDDILTVMGDGKKLSTAFCLPLVAHALDVIDNGGTRDDFDRKVGSYGHGYPSLTRSHFYYHRLRALRARAHGSKSLKGVEDADVRKQEMKKLRRATRWLFHQVRSWAQGQ